MICPFCHREIDGNLERVITDEEIRQVINDYAQPKKPRVVYV